MLTDEEEEVVFDLDSIPHDDEEDDRLLNGVMRNYFPMPGDFHCYKEVDHYIDRMKKVNERFMKSQGQPTAEDLGENSALNETFTKSPAESIVTSVPIVIPVDEPKDTQIPLMPDVTPKPKPDVALKTKKVQEAPKVTTGQKGKRRAAVAKTTTEPYDGDGADESNNEYVARRPKMSRNVYVWLPKPPFHGLRSLFTEDEQAKYVGMVCNILNVGRMRFEGNVMQYEAMKDKLKKETENFNDYVKSVSQKDLVKANNYLPLASMGYVANALRGKSAIVQSMPKRFIMSGMQYITYPAGGEDWPVLVFSKHLLDVGIAPRIVLPDLTRKATVPMEDVAQVEAKYPTENKSQEGLLSKDKNLLALINKYKADFIASTSALRSILMWKGPLLSDECELPIIVEPAYIHGSRTKVVYISKPLPPRKLTKRQQLFYMAKYAVKTKLIDLKYDINKARTYSSTGGRNRKPAAEEESIDFDNYEPDAVETFGASASSNTRPINVETNVASPPPLMTSEMNTTNDSSIDSDDSFDREGAQTDGESRHGFGLRRGRGGLTDAEGDDMLERTNRRSIMRNRSASISRLVKPRSKSVVAEPPKETAKMKKMHEAGDVLSGIMSDMQMTAAPTRKAVGFQMQSNKLKPGDFYALEDPRDYTAPLKTGCLRQYLLWNIKNFQILTRSNIDGLHFRSNSECRTTISAKPEYQPMYGAEEQTVEETVYDYLTVFLKQSDLHLRAHVKFDLDNDLLGVDMLEKKQLYGGAFEGFPTTSMFGSGMRRLHAVLEELNKLNPGSYILRIQASEPGKLTILRADEESASGFGYDSGRPEIDLSKQYSHNWLLVPENVQSFDDCWRKIDSTTLFQWHRIAKRIPTTFPPRLGGEEPKLVLTKDSMKKERGGGGKKGKKKGRSKKRKKPAGKQQKLQGENVDESSRAGEYEDNGMTSDF